MFTNDFSKEIWQTTYKTSTETDVKDTWRRVSRAVSAVERTERQGWESKFYSLLEAFSFVPGGRILANIGTDKEKTTLYNCFVSMVQDLGIKDPDSIEGIYGMLLKQAQTLKSEGGYGTNCSWIRPEGAYIKGIGARSPGALKFMELWDKSSEIITAGSVKRTGEKKDGEKVKIRKGAQMLILEVWHPEILDFIVAKQTPNRFTKFNMSVGITEGFMEAVKQDLDWTLKFPDTDCASYKEEWNGNIEAWEAKRLPVIVYQTVKAKTLWESVMKSTYDRAEPGVLFIDLCNKLNPLAYAENVRACNPCQPSWAKILTKLGVRQFRDISVGDEIWSKDGWTKIINKKSSGIKSVYEYNTTAGRFYGTENHKLVSFGEKKEAKDCEAIDIIAGEDKHVEEPEPLDVMDGLVIGDGSFHAASNNLVHLYIGQDDHDYFSSEVASHILKHRPGIKETAYEIKTTITHEELPKTYERLIPSRFIYGGGNKACGFLRGLFSANGSLCGDRVTLKASSLGIIKQVQLLLSSIGIKSYYTTNKPTTVQFSNGQYDCRKSYDLNISTDRQKFAESIGFIQRYKNEKLTSIIKGIIPLRRKESYDVISVSLISEEEVFDITVDNPSHTYWTEGCNVSNCGEINMATGVCCLGSLNLTQFVENKHFNYDKFSKYISLGIRFLDNVLDISKTPLKEYSDSVIHKRRIGLGVMGLGSLHFMLGIKFGSKESLELVDKIFKLKCETELLTSAKLGTEKGSFLDFDADKHFDTFYWKNLPISDSVKKEIQAIGCMRNSHQSMNAPTGNTGILANNVSGGIEPVFMKDYIRWSIVNEAQQGVLIQSGLKYPMVSKGEWFETDQFKFIHRGSEQVLKGSFNGIDYEIDKNRGLVKATVIEDYGWGYARNNISDCLMLNESGIFATTESLSVADHVNILAIASKYTNQACSKTVNVPNDYSYNDFEDIYMKAWELGIKGLTTYRSGTMSAVLTAIDSTPPVGPATAIPKTIAPKRPKELRGEIFPMKYKKDNLFVAVGFYGEDLYEIFAGNNPDKDIHHYKGKIVKNARSKYSFIADNGEEYHLNNGHSDENADALCRILSASLRHGCDLKFLIEQLGKSEGIMVSFCKVIARSLKKFIKDGTESTDNCAVCGGRVIFSQGCSSCCDCGASKCS